MKPTETPRITVAIRKRPLNKKESQRGETDIVRVGAGGQVVVSEYKQKVDLTKYIEENTFRFDFAYDESADNATIYAQAIQPLIRNAFQGAKISCFAYGQTGSGKTYTMKGEISRGVPGLYYLGARQIFSMLEMREHEHLHMVVSFYQIYCGKLFDLLANRNQLKIREDKKQNINIIGAEQKEICSTEEFLDLIEYGNTFRVTSQNATNADSSRSHAILQISLKNGKHNFSKISFIDLAGNQRGADHMDQNKQTKIDGAQINKSLLSLKECIRALDQGKSHTPFRGSKLTMVLKDSFVGFCNTVMICNVAPNQGASQNTMNTLRYADRVKELKGGSGEQVSKEEMHAREMMLPRGNNKNVLKVNITNDDDEEDINAKMQLARQRHGKAESKRPQAMEAEEPVQLTHKPVTQSNSKRAETGRERKMNHKPSSKDLHATIKGKDTRIESKKQPLNLKNVHKKIDQNNAHLANHMQAEPTSHKHYPPPQTAQFSPQSLNRAHFEAMAALRSGFEGYRQGHEQMIKEEMHVLREEMEMKQHLRTTGIDCSSYESQVQEVRGYVNRMQQFLASKMHIYQEMQAQIDRLKRDTMHAQELNSRVRQAGWREQGAGLRQAPPQQFYGPMPDEQLLEGLSGEEHIAKLF